MNSITKIFDDTIQTDHKVITEEAAKSILKKYGIKVPGFALVKSTNEAVKAAKKNWISISNESSFTTNLA